MMANSMEEFANPLQSQAAQDARNTKFRVRTCHGLEYDCPRAIAQYLVDDKEAVLTATKEAPIKSWSGNSVVWRESTLEA